MFKVGDRVVCVDATNQARDVLKAGDEYLVVGINTYNGVHYVVVGSSPHDAGWKPQRFIRADSLAGKLNQLPVIPSNKDELIKIKIPTRYIVDDTEKRKEFPLYDGLFGYFPNALAEVARWSVAGNNQHNPGQPLHWDMSKSTDHKNKIFRHTLDAEEMNSEGFYEAIGAAWRALALAEEILLKAGKKPGTQVRNNPYA